MSNSQDEKKPATSENFQVIADQINERFRRRGEQLPKYVALAHEVLSTGGIDRAYWHKRLLIIDSAR